MTPTKAESLAARLESGWCPIESPADMGRAAAELRRLAAVEAERDALLAAIPEGCTPADAAMLREANHQLAAERDALRADSERWRSLYARAINEANGLTNYVEDRPELRRAEKQLEAIQREARAIDAAMKGTT